VLCVTSRELQDQVKWVRREFLPQAVALTELPQSAQDALVDAETPLTNGLSKGVEVTDRAKSSFYFHPVTDRPGAHVEPKARVPLFHNENLFPTEEQLPGFKASARRAAQLVVSVGHELAQLIDRRLDLVPGYASGSLTAVVRKGPDSNHKCRLIRYHPYETEEEVIQTKGMWAAPHLDTGSLTGLVPGIFVDARGQPAASPDASTGLYVLDRQGKPLKAELPSGVADGLFFQIGESLQIISGSELQATPHYVQGPSCPQPGGVSRCSMAVFMQPQPHELLPIPSKMSYEEVAGKTADRHLPASWPSLEKRFKQLGLSKGQVLTFGQHGEATFSNLGRSDD